ncbi:MAG: hypothetical protein R2710_21320 [Acidimicrobiales bacterium]
MPVPDLSTSQLEHLSDRSMPGRERTWVDGWVCCAAADGVTSRANCCTPLGPIGDSISATVDAVDSWYRGRDLPTVFQLWEGADFAITTELDRRGYTTIEEQRSWRARCTTLRLRPPAATGSSSMTVSNDALLSKTTPIDWPSWPCHRSPKSSPDVGTARGCVAAASVSSMAPPSGCSPCRRPRRSTPGTRAVDPRRTAGRGRARDLDVAWLQVAPSNTGAKQLYERFGFATAHAYHYRAAPPLGLS